MRELRRDFWLFVEIRQGKAMELKEALNKAAQILDEERKFPSVQYESAQGKERSPLAPIAIISDAQYLRAARLRRPREVLENTQRFQFESTNYDLLCALSSQLAAPYRQTLLRAILRRVVSWPACGKTNQFHYPAWVNLVSELPLVAEFAVRNGHPIALFQILSEAKPIPGHVLLLKQFEDMIALNFNVLSEEACRSLSSSVGKFRVTTSQLLAEYESNRPPTLIDPTIGPVYITKVFDEIIGLTKSIEELCRKACYLYVKGSLLEGLNLEINQDKTEVESYLEKLGFSQTLIDSLNEADRLYRTGATAFDFKSSMGHLRSFLENLHSEAVIAIAAKGGASSVQGWGPGLTFLRQEGVFSKPEEEFTAKLYTLISDEAVHPLIAEREFARLARNMTIEHGLLLLRKLQKRGLKV